jgi:C1A family cysteine protease
MEDFSCILSWGKDYGISYSYLYISKVKVGNIGINLPLAYSQAPSDHFQLVYQNPAAMIYRAVDNP